jgi:hypothetical protein
MQDHCDKILWSRAFQYKYGSLSKITYKMIEEIVDRFRSCFKEIMIGSNNYNICKQFPVSYKNRQVLHDINIYRNPMGYYDVEIYDHNFAIDSLNLNYHQIVQTRAGRPSEFCLNEREFRKLLFLLSKDHLHNHSPVEMTNNEYKILKQLGYLL